MPEPITLSVVAISALTALAKDFLKGVAKKSAAGLKELFKGDETRAILNEAFQEFKAYCFNENSSTEEKILLRVFEEFFTDDRTIREFQLVFAGQSHQVDFNLMEEIFVGCCIENKIEIPTFDFFRALSQVIKSIETIAEKEETFKKAIRASKLEGLYNALQKRDQEVNLTFAHFKYLHQLSRHNNRLQFTGIPDPKEKKDIELPEVFVMQRARESVAGEDYKQLLREHEGDKAFSDEEVLLRQIMPVHREETRPAVKFNQVLEESDNRRFVVLGKPGSGKSSLLKFLMLTAAQKHLDFHRDSQKLPFPIFVEIRKLEHALAGSTEPDYNILEFLYDSMSREYGLRLPGGFFENYLDKGKALLLFDGLDEVAAEPRRAEVRRMISAFITSRHPGNTVIVTSRIAGYSRARFSTTDYRHFTLEDFNEEEIETFINRWYRSRLSNPAEADSKAEDLKEALKKKPRIRELAKNPLLLTIIGIIHRYEAQLPEDRLVLYDKAAEALLYTWDNVKKIIDEKFKLSHRQRFLGKVAFHLQSIEKGDEAGTMMDRHELYAILLEDFCKVFDCENWEAKGLVDEFLETIRLRAGLLVELAPDKFGFAHKTFQEYFAARWIANEAILKFNLQIMKDHVDQFIDNAFWQETLLLALRALPCEQAKHVLEHILERDPRGIETYFYHNHYFVMKFIAEQGQWLDSKEFVEKQVDDFFKFSWNEGKDRSYYKNFTWKRFNDWLSSVSDYLACVYLYKKLLSAAEDQAQNFGLRRNCAYAVGQLGHKDKAVEILLGLAQDQTQDVYIRRYCAYGLGQLGHKDKAVEILIGMAEDKTQDVEIRIKCAYELGQLGHKDKAVVERLLGMAEDKSQSVYLRRYCAYSVGRLGHKEKDVVVRLLGMAEDQTQDVYLRRSCAEAVGKLGHKENAVVERLLGLAEDQTQDVYLRRSCAKVVGQLGHKDKAVVVRLLGLAHDQTQDVDLRCNCAEAVGQLGYKDKIVIERLLGLAEDQAQEGGLRRSCAEVVGQLGHKDKAVEILLGLAEDQTQFISLRRNCAEAVGRLGHKENAVEILLGLAEDQTQFVSLRLPCAEAVGQLGHKEKVVVERLLGLAQETQDVDLWRTCAESVGRLGHKDKAVDILVNLYLAQPDKTEDDARRIYDSLWQLTVV